MNILEAIKTGKALRRKSPMSWFHPGLQRYSINDPERGHWIGAESILMFLSDFPREYLLAEDWEVKPEPIAITSEQFFKAIKNAYLRECREKLIRTGGISAHWVIEYLAQELGFKEKTR